MLSTPGEDFRVGGGPYTVAVSMTDSSQVSSVSLTISFNPSVLRVRTVQEGSFLRAGGVAAAFTQQVDPTTGRVDIAIVRSNDPTGVAGTGLLAAILFDAVGGGSANLALTGAATGPRGASVPLQTGSVPAVIGQMMSRLGSILERRVSAERGYTFVELLVVTTILLILASAVMPLAQVTSQRQREAELRRSLRELRTAIDAFKDAVDLGRIPTTELEPGNEGYPPDLETLVEGISAANDATGRKLRFLRRIPIDPLTGEYGVGIALLSGFADVHLVGRAECVRRVFQGRRHRSRRHGVSSVVALRTFALSHPRTNNRGTSGFTLIELMIVMSLIVVLAGITISVNANGQTRAREAVLKEDLFRMRDAIDQVLRRQRRVPSDTRRSRLGEVSSRRTERPVHELIRDLADDHVRD